MGERDKTGGATATRGERSAPRVGQDGKGERFGPQTVNAEHRRQDFANHAETPRGDP